jgi:tol-pal system protein YbgF
MRRRHARAAIAGAALVIGLGWAMSGCGSGERAAQQREILALRSQIEEVRKSQETQAREFARLAGEMKALDAQSTFVLSEVKASGEERARVKAALAESSTALTELGTRVDGLGKAVAALPATPPAASVDQLYAAAMEGVKSEEYTRALGAFRELTTRFPDDPLASHAQYWIGEAYYRLGNFSEAVVEFRKVVDRYPASAQVPETLLKIGLSHRALQDQPRARAAWEQVAQEFPGTSAASQARSLLATLGGSAAPSQ